MLIIPIIGVLISLAGIAVIIEDAIRIKTGGLPESYFEHRFED
jgi:hypothetical protein